MTIHKGWTRGPLRRFLFHKAGGSTDRWLAKKSKTALVSAVFVWKRDFLYAAFVTLPLSSDPGRDSGCAFGEHFADALDLGAHAAKFFFNALITAINVINAVENGFAFGDESSNHQ